MALTRRARGLCVGGLLVAGLLAADRGAIAEDILHLPIGDPARRDKDAPVVLDAVTDTQSGRLLEPAELSARLSDVRLVLVGEEHTGMSQPSSGTRNTDLLDRNLNSQGRRHSRKMSAIERWFATKSRAGSGSRAPGEPASRIA